MTLTNILLNFETLQQIGYRILDKFGSCLDYGTYTSKELDKFMSKRQKNNLNSESATLAESYTLSELLKEEDFNEHDYIFWDNNLTAPVSRFFFIFDNLQVIDGIKPSKRFKWEKKPSGKIIQRGIIEFPSKNIMKSISNILFADNKVQSIRLDCSDVIIESHDIINYAHSFKLKEPVMNEAVNIEVTFNDSFITKDKLTRLYDTCRYELYYDISFGMNASLTLALTNSTDETVCISFIQKESVKDGKPELKSEIETVPVIKENNDENISANKIEEPFDSSLHAQDTEGSHIATYMGSNSNEPTQPYMSDIVLHMCPLFESLQPEPILVESNSKKRQRRKKKLCEISSNKTYELF